MDNQENFENLRVASFSAYLNSSEENFVLKLTGAIKDHPFDLITSKETPSIISSVKRRTDHAGEIGIFGADKYFSMRMEHENPKLTDYNKMNKAEVDVKQSSKSTPSVFSEASSNSQRALLPKLLRNPSLIKQRKENGGSFFSRFSCNGLCSNKKSVHINKNIENSGIVQKNNHSRIESFRFANTIGFDGAKNSQAGIGEEFEFPVTKSREENLAAKERLEEENVEAPRHSIEVFGSGMIKLKGDQVERNLERKLSILTWDAIPKTQTQSSTMGSGGPFDDNQSDASSDLFEIETLAGNGNTSYTNQGSEKISGFMSPTTQYAPSEASIEWSVVTASAADFSFNAEYDEKSIAGNLISKASKEKNMERKEVRKRPGGLLGCKSHKAVSVAEMAFKAVDKAKIDAEGKTHGFIFSKDFQFASV